MKKTDKIVITGAAGLVGQNLTLLLTEQGYSNIIAIDKNTENLATLKQLNPSVQIISADLSEASDAWQRALVGANVIIMLHAQITSLYNDVFVKNNITATQYLLDAIRKQPITPYLIHISSSVVIAQANDDYTNTKKEQEKLVLASGINCCVLRPTLMFGWFDPKHFGWLSRFMEKTPIFPIPGDGKYQRQPLYSRDFCRVIMNVMEKQPHNKIFDIVGQEEIDYIDIIRAIKKTKQLNTKIIKIPYALFYFLLKLYAVFSKNPPFTADQLKALSANDHFTGADFEKEFNMKPTPFKQALTETFCDERYSHIVLDRSI